MLDSTTLLIFLPSVVVLVDIRILLVRNQNLRPSSADSDAEV